MFWRDRSRALLDSMDVHRGKSHSLVSSASNNNLSTLLLY
jgi:hypothetical protein